MRCGAGHEHEESCLLKTNGIGLQSDEKRIEERMYWEVSLKMPKGLVKMDKRHEL